MTLEPYLPHNLWLHCTLFIDSEYHILYEHQSIKSLCIFAKETALTGTAVCWFPCC